jgi:hypothetical protein
VLVRLSPRCPRSDTRHTHTPGRGRAASANLRGLITAAGAAGTTRLLSVRHEFPTAWAGLTAGSGVDGTAGHPRSELTVPLRREHYPLFAGAGPDALVSLDLVARPRDFAVRRLAVADRALDTGNPAELPATWPKRSDWSSRD